MNKHMEKKLAALKRAIDKELKSLGATTIPGIEGVSDWMNKTWNNLTKSDLEDDKLRSQRRNALGMAKKTSLPVLEKNLDKNPFRDLVVDLALKVLEDRTICNETDALYALELAVELSQMSGGTPVHSLLLNAIHKNADAYSTIEELRQVEHPAQLALMEQLQTVNFFYSNESLPSAEVEGTVDEELIQNLDAERLDVKRSQYMKSPVVVSLSSKGGDYMSTDSQLFMTNVKEFDGLAGDVTYVEHHEKNTRKAREAIVGQWSRIEERVWFRVQAMRAGSPDEAFKQELRSRQKAVERLVHETEKSCADEEERAYFNELMLETLPFFKSAMGKNICKRPEFAKQVYDILDKLAEAGVALHDYLYAAVSMAQETDDSVLKEALDDLSFGDLGENAAAHVMSLIEKNSTTQQKKSSVLDDSRLESIPEYFRPTQVSSQPRA